MSKRMGYVRIRNLGKFIVLIIMLGQFFKL